MSNFSEYCTNDDICPISGSNLKYIIFRPSKSSISYPIVTGGVGYDELYRWTDKFGLPDLFMYSKESVLDCSKSFALVLMEDRTSHRSQFTKSCEILWNSKVSEEHKSEVYIFLKDIARTKANISVTISDPDTDISSLPEWILLSLVVFVTIWFVVIPMGYILWIRCKCWSIRKIKTKSDEDTAKPLNVIIEDEDCEEDDDLPSKMVNDDYPGGRTTTIELQEKNPKMTNYCTFLYRYLVPDQSVITASNIDRMNYVLLKINEQIAMKEAHAGRLKQHINLVSDPKTAVNPHGPPRQAIQRKLRDELLITLRQLKMMRIHEKTYSEAKFKLETYQNTAMVLQEMKTLSSMVKDVKIDFNGLEESVAHIQNAQVDMKEADSVMNNMNMNMWSLSEAEMDDAYEEFMNQDDFSLPPSVHVESIRTPSPTVMQREKPIASPNNKQPVVEY